MKKVMIFFGIIAVGALFLPLLTFTDIDFAKQAVILSKVEVPLEDENNEEDADEFIIQGEEQDNIQQKIIDTRLHKAVINEQVSLAEKLLNIKKLLKDPAIDVNQKDENGRTALFIATDKSGCDPAVVALLLNAGAKPNLEDFYNNTALHNAVRHEGITIARMLLKAGADQDWKNDDNLTPRELAYSPQTKALFGLE